MQQKLVGLLLLAVGFSIAARACDVCGCAVSATYFGVMPQVKKHFVGLRFASSTVDARSIPSLFDAPSSSVQQFNRMEMQFRLYLHPKVVLSGTLPYQYHLRKESGQQVSGQGIGDASAWVNWIALNTGDSGRLKLRQMLLLGGGIKAPTGKYDPNASASLQTGTGSWDALVNASYILRYQQWGLQQDVQFRNPFPNTHSYQFGSAFTYAFRFFYWRKVKLISILPSAGMQWESINKDVSNHILQHYTGGTGTYANAGFDLFSRRYNIGLQYALPLQEQLFGGLAHTRSRISAHINILF